MLDGCRKISVSVLVLFIAALWCAPAAARQQTHKTSKVPVKKDAAQPQVAPMPHPTPPTPEQMPATPAQVTFQNNQLTILARNSTVGDILRSVRKQTGATVDAPPNATQRVVGQFGPGPARDVLASVLDASGFNYVLLGSATNPNALQNVIVSVKSNEPVGSTPPPSEPNNQADDSQSAPADEQEAGPPSESFVPQDNDSNSSDDQSSQEEQAAPVKTPEQLLQELQRQQQLQQLQNQQNQSAQPPASRAAQDEMHQNQR